MGRHDNLTLSLIYKADLFLIFPANRTGQHCVVDLTKCSLNPPKDVSLVEHFIARRQKILNEFGNSNESDS